MTDLLMMIDNKSVKLLQNEFASDKLIGQERFIEIMLEHVGGPGKERGGSAERREDRAMEQIIRREKNDNRKSRIRGNGAKGDVDILAGLDSSRSTCSITRRDEEWVVDQAIELFQMIDANGDGVLEWGEFSAFIVELNKNQDVEKEAMEAEDLRLFRTKNFRNNFNIQRKTIFFESCDWTDVVLTVEERSDQLRVHSFSGEFSKNVASVRVTSNFVPHRVIAGCLLAGCDQVAVATQCKDKFFLTVYDIGNQITRQSEQCQTLSGQRLMKWHPQSKTLATTGTGRGDAKGFVISIYERHERTGMQLHAAKHRLVWHHKLITCLEFLTHKHVLAGSKDGTVSIWDLDTGDITGVLELHETGVLSMSSLSLVPKEEEQWSAFWTRAKKETRVANIVSCPNPLYGDKLTDPDLSCGIVYKVSDFHRDIREISQLRGHSFPTQSVKIIPESAYIVTCDSSGACRLWNPSAEYACVQAFVLGCPSFLWTRKWLITAGFHHGGRDKLYEIAPATKERTAILFCVFNAAMACFVTATKWEIAIWEAKTGKRVNVLRTAADDGNGLRKNSAGETSREITACCLDDRERKIIVGFCTGELEVFNLFNGSFIKALDPHPAGKPVTSVFFCHQGLDRLVISTSWGGYVHICDEDDRTGYIPQKRSVKLRSIHLRDKHNGGCDITSSAFCFHLKQIATFSGRKRGSKMTTLEQVLLDKPGNGSQVDSALESTMVYVWDLEFARIQGVLKGDDGAHYEELRYVEGKLPILLGLDSVHSCVAMWCTVQEPQYPGYCRLQTVRIEGMGQLTALEAMLGPVRNGKQRIYFFVGDEGGKLKKFKVEHLHKLIPRLENDLRHQTYRGNRQAHNQVFVENLQCSRRETPSTPNGRPSDCLGQNQDQTESENIATDFQAQPASLEIGDGAAQIVPETTEEENTFLTAQETSSCTTGKDCYGFGDNGPASPQVDEAIVKSFLSGAENTQIAQEVWSILHTVKDDDTCHGGWLVG